MTEFPTFSEFFAAVTDTEPYDWQVACAEHIERSGWPDTIDVQTGLGKTSTVTMAVYELARQLHVGGRRSAPLRIFHVIDRNSIVEQSACDVERVANAVNTATTGPLYTVGETLRSTLPEFEPGLAVAHAVYRGTRRSGPRLRAFGCTITSMTAHQMVSQLLFRGFGVSAGSRPIHAGLIGVDSLILFDEPHLSQPSLTTLSDVVRLQSGSSDLGVPRLRVVTLGATTRPTTDLRTVFPGPHRQHLLADDTKVARRVEASRDITLSVVAGKSDATFVRQLVRHAVDAHAANPHGSVGIIVNTVAVARDVAKTIAKTVDDVVFMTSRVRPVDRADVQMRPGSIVVATQCIEVGVDIAFDTLVTEACPMPSLVQRIGRLNRDGERAGNGYLVSAESSSGPIARAGSAAVYGAEPIVATMKLLYDLSVDGNVDASLAAQRDWRTSDPALWPPEQRHATLTHANIPKLTMTNPRLSEDLDVDAYIQGPDAEPVSDVQIAWRADLASLIDCPPLADELVSIPISSLRDFLNGRRTTPVGMSDAGGSAPADSPGQSTGPRPKALVRGEHDAWAAPKGPLYPGDVVVIDAGDGGYSTYGWDPQSSARVADMSAAVSLRGGRGGARSFPLHESSLRQVLTADDLQHVLALIADADPADPEQRAEVLAAMNKSLDGVAAPIDAVVEGTTGGLIAQIRSTVDRRSSTARQSLAAHLEQVGTWACADAGSVGLVDPLIDAITAAALHHDDGKAAPTWQRRATGGKSVDEPIAKYVRQLPPGRVDSYLRSLSCPSGWRHDAHSFHMSIGRSDPILVAHLIASHHGWFRPFAPPVNTDGFDLTATEVDSQRFGASHARDFETLNRRYGPWGLAFLEAVVRLADWRASEHPTNVSAPETMPNFAASESNSKFEGHPTEIMLTGLTSTPTAGWFAVSGLLGAAEKLGMTAKVRWQPPSESDPRPMVPVLRIGGDLSALVEEVWTGTDFTQSDKLASGLLGHPLVPKYQKTAATDAIRSLLLKSDENTTALVAGVINDAVPANPKMELAMTAISNNSSFGKVAVEALQAPAEEAVKALLDPDVGYTYTNCDGGFDRSTVSNPLVNGIGEHGRRSTRGVLAPLVMEGFAVLGAPPRGGHGVHDRQLTLPLPTRFTDLPELRALLLVSAGIRIPRSWSWKSISCDWRLVATKTMLNKYDAHWDATFAQRSS